MSLRLLHESLQPHILYRLHVNLDTLAVSIAMTKHEYQHTLLELICGLADF